MPPKNPRSMARWMHSTLTGPTGMARRIPMMMPTGMMSGLGRRSTATISFAGTRHERRDWRIIPGAAAQPHARRSRRTVRAARGPLGCGQQHRTAGAWSWLIPTGAAPLVHCARQAWPRARATHKEAAAKKASRRKPPPSSKISYGTAKLPAPVEEMRQAILAAAHSGNIEDLRVPLDWNELKPEVGAAAGRGPDRLLEEDIGRRQRPRNPRRARRDPAERRLRSCRSARISRTTSSTSGPTSPRSSSTS